MADATPLSPGCEILLLEDDAALRKRLAAHLKATGAVVSEATRIEEARRLVQSIRYDFALMDLHLPDGEALILLREGIFSENTGVVVMTAFGGVKKAVEAIRLGAGDYLTKPFEPEAVTLAFARCRNQHTAKRRDEHRTTGSGTKTNQLFFGQSLATIRSQLDTILAAERRLENHLPCVLIEGETGTGKSALARWLHAQGPRADRPFVSVNCAALPENLVESELFGHERGAFTDARQARIGLFEAADGGTLFLDEIGALAPATQAKVLVAVEEGRIRRLGSNKEISIDARLLAASNRPLADLVAEGEFREDLYHRLHLLHLTLPPLRERGSDIVELAKHLLAPMAARHRLPSLTISAAGTARLLAHRWPGNIRELAHELERAVIFSSGPTLDFAHLSSSETNSLPEASGWRNPAWRIPEEGFLLDQVINDLVTEALRETNGNVSAAARRLGVTREFLRYRINQQQSDASAGEQS
ncbi:MAG: sigma-54 dependent transcriptional regulator [Nibricoccus sp.]